MKKLMLGCLLAACSGLMAQPTGKEKELGIEIQDNKVIIEAENLQGLSSVDLNSILREVSKRTENILKQQQEMLAKVERQEQNGEISEEEAEEMRDMINERTEESLEVIGEIMEAWGEQYEARMEAWEQAYEAKMDAWEAEVESRASQGNYSMPPLPALPPIPAPAAPGAEGDERTVIIDEDGITIREGKDGDKPFALRFEEGEEAEQDRDDEDDHVQMDRSEAYFDIHFGFNQMLRDGQYILTGSEELKFWSTAFEMGWGGKIRVGSPYSKFYVKVGGELSWHNFRLTGNNFLQKFDDSVAIGESGTINISKSKYHVAYLNLPVMLQLDFSEVGEMDESFTLGVGGYAGVRINMKRELEFDSDIYDDAEETLKSDFFANRFRYGVMAQLGWGSFKVTGKYDLNNFFEDNRGPDYQLAMLAVGFTF